MCRARAVDRRKDRMENPHIAALGAVGAWLPVAGPLYQASMELREQGFAQRRQLPENFPHPRPVSGWWWLLPPVAYVKIRAERQRIRREVLARMTPDSLERIISFSNTARGWLIVADCATLIGIKETWELVAIAEWPAFTAWVIALAALLLSFGNAAVTANRTERLLSGAAGER